MVYRLLKDKRGAETWQIVLIVIAVILLITMMVFYGQLTDRIGIVFDKLFGWL